VVEEEELPVRKQAAEQGVDAVAPQQDLEGRRRERRRPCGRFLTLVLP